MQFHYEYTEKAWNKIQISHGYLYPYLNDRWNKWKSRKAQAARIYLPRNAGHAISQTSITLSIEVTFRIPENGTSENRFAIGISSYMISATKAIWILLRLEILFARATRAYPYFSSFHLARRQSWQSRRPLFDPGQTKSKHGAPEPLSIALRLASAIGIAETGPLLAYRMGNSEVSNQLGRSNWWKIPHRNLFTSYYPKSIPAINSLASGITELS